MPALMSDNKLRHAALAALEEELGPVAALRFLALVRREPFDYQKWRDETFAGMSVEELFRRFERIEEASNT
jgi:hypothetical protein